MTVSAVCKRAAALVAVGAILTACGVPSDARPQPGSSGSSSPTSATSSAAVATTTLPGTKAALSGTTFPMTVTDWNGQQTTFTEPPKRVALVNGSSFNIWYDAGGTAVGIANKSTSNKLLPDVEQQLADVPQLGPSRAIDAEKLTALNPDLVIAAGHSQEKLVESMQAMGVNVIGMTMRTRDDLQMAYEIFGALNGKHDQAKAKFDAIKAAADEVVAKFPKEPKTKVAIVSVNPQGLTVKLPNSTAGEMANQLGLDNVVKGVTANAPNSEDAPLDIEYLVKHQPDVILVTSHAGSNQIAKERLEEHFNTNSAWQAVDAVRDGKVKFLPQEYFLLHAGPFYADAMKYMAASVHPEIFGEPTQPEHLGSPESR